MPLSLSIASRAPVRAAVAAGLAVVMATGSPATASDRAWQFHEGNDPSNKGRTTARLIFGVPETDDIQVTGVCEAAPSTSTRFANLTFGADTGRLKPGQPVKLRFSGGGFDHAVDGEIYHAAQEEGLSGVLVPLPLDDPLWKAMAETDRLDYLVPGYRATEMRLDRGRRSIRDFQEACRTYAEAAGALKPEANASGGDEKEAFEIARELGTVEAWNAFLANFPSGFRADLARAYVKKLGSGASASSNRAPAERFPGVTGRNLVMALHSRGAFVKNGPDTWVEQGATGSAVFRFKESGRSAREVKLYDASRRVTISLDVVGAIIWYAHDRDAQIRLYDMTDARAGDVTPAASRPPPSPRVPSCEDGQQLVNGRCQRVGEVVKEVRCGRGHVKIEGRCIKRRDASTYCGPGYRLQGNKCVAGYRAPKPQKQLPSWQVEAIKKGCKPGQGWNAQEGCHEDD